MLERKHKLQKINNVSWGIAGTLLLFLTVALLLWFVTVNSQQAQSAIAATVCFMGEYRVGDGDWQEIVEGQHIPATKGDVILRGNFHLFAPDGEYVGIMKESIPLAFYTDHISLTICEGNNEPYVTDHENPLYGVSACGKSWTAHTFSGDGTEPVEILIHNPHSFGNERAVDEFLSKVAIWGTFDFERGVMASGKFQRNAGLLFIMVSLVMLGTALFSALLHVPNSRIIWLFGFVILFAGIYLAYSASGVSFWSEEIAVNTTVLGVSMMFYMLFVLRITACFLNKTQKIGFIASVVLGVVEGICILVQVVTKSFFYDTWGWWVITQTVANGVLLGCMGKEFKSAAKKKRWTYVGMAFMLVAFELDVAATIIGWWQGGFISVYVFAVLFVVALVVILRIIPANLNAASKAKELELQSSRLEAEKNMIEAKLKESRISIMLSQIQPHFIYNTLGTIERMCLKDPEKAFDLVRNFSLYLRGNFSELDSVTPIRFSEEMKHVEYYVNIEKVRFPDMNIEYKLEVTDFVLPALSVQPLVENAIKHGLMRLETGGTVVIRSYETEKHFCVEVMDDGGGFDTNLPIDEKKHVGLRNIRERLKVMVDGELHMESKVGAGTKALIKIPKEVAE